MIDSSQLTRWFGVVGLGMVLSFQSQAQVYILEEKKPEKIYLPGEIDPDEANGAWVFLVGNHAKQEAQDFTSGYRVNTLGMGLGKDWIFSEHGFVGFGVRFDYTDLNSTHYNGPDVDFSSTKLFAYGRYDFTDRWFFNASASYGFNEYNTNRPVQRFNLANTPAYVTDVHGDSDGRQWSLMAETGYQFSCRKWQFLPIASVSYTHLSIDDYAELGAPGFNLRFSEQSYQSLKFSLDGVIAYQNEFPLAQLLPYMHARIIYDTQDDAVESTADVLGGPTLFPTFGFVPAQTSYQLGAGFTVFGQKNMQVSMRYDYTFKHHYNDHQAVIYVRHEW